jgi:hypothetical protein
MILDKHLTLRDMLEITLGRRTNTLTTFQNMGILVLQTSSGTRPDGSVQWGHFVLAGQSVYDFRFWRGLDFIKRGTANYEYAEL